MLTADLVGVRRRGDELRLVPVDDRRRAHIEALAAALARVAREHVGKTRDEVDDALDGAARGTRRLRGGAGGDQRLTNAVLKLVRDGCRFDETDPEPAQALRRDVFRRAAAARRAATAIAPFDRDALLAAVGGERGVSAADIEAGLYADRPARQRLLAFEGRPAAAVAAGFTLSQAQAVLLRATKVTAVVRAADAGTYRQLFRTLKFLRLLPVVTPAPGPGGGFRIELDGPFSLFQGGTRYGLQLGLALPAIAACDAWSVEADVAWGADRRALKFRLEGKAAALARCAALPSPTTSPRSSPRSTRWPATGASTPSPPSWTSPAPACASPTWRSCARPTARASTSSCSASGAAKPSGAASTWSAPASPTASCSPSARACASAKPPSTTRPPPPPSTSSPASSTPSRCWRASRRSPRRLDHGRSTRTAASSTSVACGAASTSRDNWAYCRRASHPRVRRSMLRRPDAVVSHQLEPEMSDGDDHTGRGLRDRLGRIGDPLALFERMFAHSPVAHLIFGADGRPVACNTAYRELFGQAPPPEYNVLDDDSSALPGIAGAARRALLGEIVRTPQVWYQRDAPHADGNRGKRVAVECCLFPLDDGDSGVAHVAVAYKDVTAETDLRASERQLRLITDALPALVTYMGPDRRFRFANNAYMTWFGVEPAVADRKARARPGGRHRLPADRARTWSGRWPARRVQYEREVTLAGRPHHLHADELRARQGRARATRWATSR